MPVSEEEVQSSYLRRLISIDGFIIDRVHHFGRRNHCIAYPISHSLSQVSISPTRSTVERRPRPATIGQQSNQTRHYRTDAHIVVHVWVEIVNVRIPEKNEKKSRKMNLFIARAQYRGLHDWTKPGPRRISQRKCNVRRVCAAGFSGGLSSQSFY
jgi:hypothetical protein